MAIVTETYMLNGREFTRTYSDANRYVVRDGIEYGEANDPSEFGRIYTEGDIMEDSETPSEDTESEAQEIVDILTGEIE